VLVGAESDGPIETPSLAAAGSPRGDEPHAPDGLPLPKPQPATPDASRCFSQTSQLPYCTEASLSAVA
ncbi:Canalicular multispecific organic anion transporter, partial [Giardia duodenalis]